MILRPDRSVPAADGTDPFTLSGAFGRTIAFPTARTLDAMLSAATVVERAAEEAAFGRVAVDESGLTAGMRLHAFQPVRSVLSAWREARAPFDRLMVPHMKDIDAIDRLDAEIAALQAKSDEDAARREAVLTADARWRATRRSSRRTISASRPPGAIIRSMLWPCSASARRSG
jgi:hypothetical protein